MPSVAAVPATTDDVTRYRRLFSLRQFDYASHDVRRDEGVVSRGAWTRPTAASHPPIDDAQLRAVLDGHLALATYAPDAWVDTARGGQLHTLTRFVAVDLDNQGDGCDLRKRATGVYRALGLPTFVLSSPGNGVHLYYMFASDTHLWSLRAPGGTSGAVMRLLAAHGLPEERGRVEVYPTARIASENQFRLPFGIGAYLLDPYTLEVYAPALSGARALRAVDQHLGDGTWEFHDPAIWHDASRAVRVRPRTRQGSREWLERQRYAAALLHTGLTAFGQRQRAVVALAYLFHSQDVGRSAAVAATQQWLRDKHNNHSRTWNEAINKAAVLEDTRRTVEDIYARCDATRPLRSAELPMLTTAEISPVVNLALDIAQRERSGERTVRQAGTSLVRIDPVKLLDFALLLMRRFVQEALRPSAAAHSSDTQMVTDTRRGIARRHSRADDGRFVLAMPATLMETGHGGGNAAVCKDAVPTYRRFLEEQLPLRFSQHSQHFAQGAMCRKYRVFIDLGGERTISSVGEAFAAVASAGTVRPLVSRRTWRRIKTAFA